MINGHKIASPEERHIEVLLRILAGDRNIIGEKTVSFSVFYCISIKVYREIGAMYLLGCDPENILGCKTLLF